MSKLTVRKIETAKGPAKLVDEQGLYLRVSPRGAKTAPRADVRRGRGGGHRHP